MRFPLFLFLLLIAVPASAVNDTLIQRKRTQAVRVERSFDIDGLLQEPAWQSIPIAANFIQNSPTEGAAVSFDTEVKIAYDNTTLYIGAMMYDNHPDSISKQSGIRDSYLNADNFRVVFDTYNTQQDAFIFIVTASGVQSDSRMTDPNYNAVWKSNVKILPNGWSVEIAIPWSALRFPTEDDRAWGVQFTRNIQRKFEFDQWALTPKGQANPMKYYGLLQGLKNIVSPLRLSLTPYATAIWERDQRFGPQEGSGSLAGGMDVKYGINESFTLDMTLLPDFSQVQSDNIVKNLRAFEVQFADFRPFFTEGVDLFQRGNLFYSRRIGKTPDLFYSVPYMTNDNEVVIKNPSRAKLLNATKVSGRTNNGIGIGVLNAIVDNTYATVRDTLTGAERRILTEPRSNYNIAVFDKQLDHGSNVYFINTNVIRSGKNPSSNVTGAGFSFNDKANIWNVSGNGGLSNNMTPDPNESGVFTSNIGYRYDLGAAKTSGTWQFGASREEVHRNWDINDLGINFETNYAANNAFISYNQFNPKGAFNMLNITLSNNYTYNLQSKDRMSYMINFNFFGQLTNFWTIYFGGDLSPVEELDFFEPRTPGRYYTKPKSATVWGGVNTNTNKKLSGGINFWGGSSGYISPTIPRNPWLGIGGNITWRATDRFSMDIFCDQSNDIGDRGFVFKESDGTIVFGRRILHGMTSNINFSYVFKTDMTISVLGRHYWQSGKYTNYYVLLEDGYLRDYVNYSNNHDFNFNSFNVDIVYSWIFAPGSILSASYRLNTLQEDQFVNYNYWKNFSGTVQGPQYNQFSLRVLYFIDYLYIKKWQDNRKNR